MSDINLRHLHWMRAIAGNPQWQGGHRWFPRHIVRPVGADHETGRLPRAEAHMVARRFPLTYHDYPEAWHGFLWPADTTAKTALETLWHYEVVGRFSGRVLDSGTDTLPAAFRFLNDKR